MVDAVDYYVKAAAGWWERIFPKPDKITWTDKASLNRAKGIRIADPVQDAEVLSIVSKVYSRAGEKTPKVIIYKSDQPNAMHLPNGTIAISDSKIATASPESLEATIAHEMGHHRQRFATLGVVLARGTAMIATASYVTNKLKPQLEKAKSLSALAITATFSAVATAFHFVSEVPFAAYRRWQELDADTTSVKVTGSAAGMVHNLEGHASRKAELEEKRKAAGTPEPSGFTKTWKELTTQHPSHEKRIAHAREVEAQLKGDRVIG